MINHQPPLHQDNRYTMPFTLAHPAAIIPLQRVRYLSLLPLIIGSMVPDVLSYAPYRFHWLFPDAHTLPGLIPLDVPLSYVILFIVVSLRRLLIAPLWGAHRALLQSAFDRFLAQPYCWLIAAPSLLLGAFTHLLWDNFTHADRWMVRRLPFLQQPLFPASEHPLQLFHALQYISSVIGLLFIAWCYWRALQAMKSTMNTASADQVIHPARRYLLPSLIILPLVCGLAFASRLPHELMSTYTFLSATLRITMASFVFVYLCAGLILEFNQQRSHQ